MHREIYERRYDESNRQTDTNTCPECGGHVTMNRAEVVCDACGLVIADEQVDLGPDWRTGGDDAEEAARTGAPRTPARHDRGLSTQIGHGTDANGNRLDSQTRRRLGRLRREQRRAKQSTTAERNQALGLTEIRRIAGALGLARSLRDQACRLFTTAQDAELLVGRSVEGMAGAAVYVACRCNETPRRLQSIAAVSKVAGDRIQHCVTVLNRELSVPLPPANPTSYVGQLASEVELPAALTQTAREYARTLPDDAIVGYHPVGVAAGCVYAAAHDAQYPVTQTALAEAAGVSAVTVRARVRDVRRLCE